MVKERKKDFYVVDFVIFHDGPLNLDCSMKSTSPMPISLLSIAIENIPLNIN